MRGNNDGQACDIDSYNRSFPAPGPSTAGSSLDCFPDSGKNVSGTGLSISVTQTTGTSVLAPAAIECGFPPFVTFDCPCGACSNETGRGCSSNTDCLGAGVCEALEAGSPQADQCASGASCVDIGGGEGECSAGPIDAFCDGIVMANGDGFISCLGNSDCEPGSIGVDAGACVLSRMRSCYLDPVTSMGTADSAAPIGTAVFCMSASSSGGLNVVTGLPGPVRLKHQAAATLYCGSDPGTQYQPGIGGCP